MRPIDIIHKFVRNSLKYNLFILLILSLIYFTLSGCSVGDDEESVRLIQAEGTNRGEVILHEPLSGTAITVRVEDTNGHPLSGQVVRLVSDGELYDALTYDPTGTHVPAFYFGALRGQSVQRSRRMRFGPRHAYAFAPFTFTMQVTALEPGAMVFTPLTSAGHFQFLGISDGSILSLCTDRQAFATSQEVAKTLGAVRTGLIMTPERLAVWAFNQIDSALAIRLLAEELYVHRAAGTPYQIDLLTTEDNLFALFLATDEVCDQAEPFVVTSADKRAHNDVACTTPMPPAACDPLSVALATTP